MSDFNYEANDEVFNLLTRKVGTVLNVKEVNSSITHPKKYVRVFIKSDMPDDKYNTPHIDVPDANFKSLLYYVNDSDGDTFVFNETFHDRKDLTIRKRVSPKKGRAVVIDSNTWHASSNPRNHANRIVLNLIFSVK